MRICQQTGTDIIMWKCQVSKYFKRVFHYSEERKKKTDQEETSDTLCFSAEHVRLRILKVSAAGTLDGIKTGSEGY